MLDIILGDQAVAQLVKKFPAFYGTRMFITLLTRPATGSYSKMYTKYNIYFMFPLRVIRIKASVTNDENGWTYLSIFTSL